MSGSSLTSSGSTRRWRLLRSYVIGRDRDRCQAPGEQPAEAGTWAALHAPADWPRDHNGRALVCGSWASHADHVVPRIKGGTDDLANVRASCARHNLTKGGRLDTELGAPTQQRPARWDW